ncbi:MAG: sugar phosphate isomerase/epimerase [Deinococcota bacterium]|nr:sugar phosphate isomerase/epimerase [Deinococcota bacterium]
MTSFGINLSFAVKRWPEPEAWAAFVREDLDLTLVQFSFDLLEPWWPEDLTRPLAARVRSAAEANGLTLHSAFVGLAAYTYNALLHPDPAGREAAKAWYRRAIRLAAEMGAPAVGGPVGGLSVRDAARSDTRRVRYEELLESLAELADYAKGQGLEALLVEPTPLPREIPWTVEEAQRLLADLGETPAPIRYCLDVGHALYKPRYGQEARLEPWLAGLGEGIGLVHLQQTDGLSDSHWGFTRPGIVTPDGVARALQVAGLGDVPLVLELFYPFELDDAQVVTDVKESVRLCKAALVASPNSRVPPA